MQLPFERLPVPATWVVHSDSFSTDQQTASTRTRALLFTDHPDWYLPRHLIRGYTSCTIGGKYLAEEKRPRLTGSQTVSTETVRATTRLGTANVRGSRITLMQRALPSALLRVSLMSTPSLCKWSLSLNPHGSSQS